MFNIFIFPRGKISPKSSSSRTAAAYGKGELHSWLISCLEVPWSEFWKGNYTTKQRKVKDNVGTSPSTVRARWISGTSAGIRPAWTAEIFFVTHICWLKSNTSLGHSGKELEFFHWEVLSQKTGEKKKKDEARYSGFWWSSINGGVWSKSSWIFEYWWRTWKVEHSQQERQRHPRRL